MQKHCFVNVSSILYLIYRVLFLKPSTIGLPSPYQIDLEIIIILLAAFESLCPNFEHSKQEQTPTFFKVFELIVFIHTIVKRRL